MTWAPAAAPASLVHSTGLSSPQRRLASAGSDKLVKIWVFSDSTGWTEEHTLRGHNDWVRDVSWAPSIGLPGQILASCSQDATVIIWTQEDPGSAWASKILPKFGDVVWRVSWSVTGNILAVASGDSKVSLWKEAVDGEWKQVQAIDEQVS